MFRLVAIAGTVLLLSTGAALAQNSCSAKAVGKDAKPLHGAARITFMKKCCEASAVSSSGARLAGAARASYITKCLNDRSFPAPARRG